MNDERRTPWSWFKSERIEAEAEALDSLNADNIPTESGESPEPNAQPDSVSGDETANAAEQAWSAIDDDQHEAELNEVAGDAEEFAEANLTADDHDSPVHDDSVEEEDLHDTEWPSFEPDPEPRQVRSVGRRKKSRSLKKPELPRAPLTPEQKLLLLDTWQKSGLPARDFGALVGVSRHTLYSWKKKFEREGPAGLMEQKRGGRRGSRLPDLTKRAILMMKEAHPDWGCQRISDMLTRGPALPASASAVARVLKEAGYEMEERATRPNPDRVRSFERAQPNQMWQTDLFSFVLKRQNRRAYLVAFMDDQSRFIVGYGLHASQSAALVIEVLRGALTAWGPPQEILTDNGAQYVTWRGKSRFTRELEKRGIRQIVAKPRRPQTLGKIERFWGTLWRECLESAIFTDVEEARQRIGLFIDYYNFQRPHQGINGLVPADRFFKAAPEVLQTLKSRVSETALELARNGVPKQPFYLTGQVDGKPFSVHREGDRVVLRKAGEPREEIDLEQAQNLLPDQINETEENATETLPAALTPDGSPQTAWNPPDAELPPGVSGLDNDSEDSATEDDGGES